MSTHIHKPITLSNEDVYIVRVSTTDKSEADDLYEDMQTWKRQRDEARRLAEVWRDRYCNDGAILVEAPMLPWEVEK